jgi:hypothetical protein
MGGSAQLLWQGPAQIRVGDSFSLQLVMQADRPVVSVPLAIAFDPRLLQVSRGRRRRLPPPGRRTDQLQLSHRPRRTGVDERDAQRERRRHRRRMPWRRSVSVPWRPAPHASTW